MHLLKEIDRHRPTVGQVVGNTIGHGIPPLLVILAPHLCYFWRLRLLNLWHKGILRLNNHPEAVHLLQFAHGFEFPPVVELAHLLLRPFLKPAAKLLAAVHGPMNRPMAKKITPQSGIKNVLHASHVDEIANPAPPGNLDVSLGVTGLLAACGPAHIAREITLGVVYPVQRSPFWPRPYSLSKSLEIIAPLFRHGDTHSPIALKRWMSGVEATGLDALPDGINRVSLAVGKMIILHEEFGTQAAARLAYTTGERRVEHAVLDGATIALAAPTGRARLELSRAFQDEPAIEAFSGEVDEFGHVESIAQMEVNSSWERFYVKGCIAIQ